MNYWKSVEIINCEINDIPANAFVNFGTLNYFAIHGGKVNQVQTDALAGLVVTRMFDSVSPGGELSIVDVEFPSNTFPTGFLTPQPGLSKLTVHRSGLDVVPVDFVSHMKNLNEISLDNNGFTSLPNGLFNGLKGMTTLNAAGINWQCTCGNMWWVTYVEENGMRITSEMLCHSPTSYYGQKAAMYNADACDGGLQCDDGTLPAVNLASVTYLTYLQIAIYTFAVIAFIGLCVLLGCWIHTRRQVNRMGGGGGGPSKGGGRRPSNNRVAGAPGGRAAPPGIKPGW